MNTTIVPRNMSCPTCRQGEKDEDRDLGTFGEWNTDHAYNINEILVLRQ